MHIRELKYIDLWEMAEEMHKIKNMWGITGAHPKGSVVMCL